MNWADRFLDWLETWTIRIIAACGFMAILVFAVVWMVCIYRGDYEAPGMK